MTHLEGQDQLERQLSGLAAVFETRADKIELMWGPGLVLQSGAKQRAPVLTGDLRRSYQLGEIAGSAALGVGSHLPYAPTAELGYRNRRPHPHLMPAAVEGAPAMQRALIITGVAMLRRGTRG